MKTLGLIANTSKPRAAEVLRKIVSIGRRLNLSLVADPATARLVRGLPSLPTARFLERAEAFIAIGGDGTMLRAVRELDGCDKPLLGVNIGALGFLTSVAEEDIRRVFEGLSKNRYGVSVRAMAACSVVRGTRNMGRYQALNDVVVSGGPSTRILGLDVSIDGDKGTSYVCDGIIVSTPTGSTGHSLSAGGPIVTPETPAFVVSLICPHTLSSRPLVLPDRSRIVIRIADCAGRARLSVDGQVGRMLKEGDQVLVTRSARTARFIHLPGHSYFSVLRQKLHWSGSNR